MLIIGFVNWWYGAGWAKWYQKLGQRIHDLFESFSVPILLRTMFEPWRRIITLPGKSIQERLRAVLDNAVSRLVGFTVRFFVLLAVLVLLVFWLIVGVLEIVIWPILPPLAIGLIVWGVI